jgi:hypothetical protein
VVPVTLIDQSAQAAAVKPPAVETAPVAIVEAPLPVNAPEGMSDIIRLVKSGVDESVVLAYIEASAIPYSLSIDDILYLNDLGTPQAVITAMLKHGNELRQAAAKTVDEPEIKPATVAEPVTVTKPEAVEPVPAVQPAPPANPGPAPSPVIVNNYYSAASNVVVPPPNGVNLSFFYESMAPYGTWIMVDNAWIWRPTICTIDPEWRPYCHGGRWVYTDCGWAWHSDYSWGWAPFHYGRWNRHTRFGWVWTPDTVWGPAWVSWRMNDAHCGWAPLPSGALYIGAGRFDFHSRHVDIGFSFGLSEFDFIFVSTGRFCEPAIYRHMVPRPQVTTIYKTTIIKNYYGDSDHGDRERRVVNHGPDVRHIELVRGQPVKKLTIVDNDTRAGQRIQSENLHGDRLAIFRPKVQDKATELPPAIIARQELAVKRHEESRMNNSLPNMVAAPGVRQGETRMVSITEARRMKEATETQHEILQKAAERETNTAKREAMNSAATIEKQKAAEARKRLADVEDAARRARLQADMSVRPDSRGSASHQNPGAGISSTKPTPAAPVKSQTDILHQTNQETVRQVKDDAAASDARRQKEVAAAQERLQNQSHKTMEAPTVEEKNRKTQEAAAAASNKIREAAAAREQERRNADSQRAAAATAARDQERRDADSQRASAAAAAARDQERRVADSQRASAASAARDQERRDTQDAAARSKPAVRETQPDRPASSRPTPGGAGRRSHD